MTSFILSMTSIEMQHQSHSLLAVSLADGQVLFYQNSALVHQFRANSNIIAMTSGRFGREEGVLIMVTKGNHRFAVSSFSPDAATED